MLDTLDPKWDPRKNQPEDYEHQMTPKEEEDENISREVDQRLTTTGGIEDLFRIFTEGERNKCKTAPERKPAENPEEETIEWEVFTDGSATNNGNDGTEAGSGIFFEGDNARNTAIKIPNEFKPSNQVAELLAVKETVEMCPPGAPIHIKSDSMYTINGLTRDLKKNEDQGFLLAANGETMKLTITKIRNRRARTRLTWVKGHSGIHGNEEADRLADKGRRKDKPDIIDTTVDDGLILPGAKIQAMTQSVAYKIIRKLKMQSDRYQDALDRKATNTNIETAQEATKDLNKESEGPATKARIWTATRHKDFSRSVRYFLWMIIHEGYKVGKHWTKIPGHEERAKCHHCGGETIETMEHILLECNAAGQRKVWQLAEAIWRTKSGKELDIDMGKIMACGAIDTGDAGLSRFFRILVSESAHLIWRMRCERVIQEKDEATENEISNRWSRTLNTRLLIDCKMTNKTKYGAKAIKPSLVRKTWAKTLQNEERLPEDWTKRGGVLVGIG
ncbi:unnamed protein product [Mycena citricolor]|uniref:ribonuclease H n=1 Tax=Mycena citricolor TaxID=2018698 RepID=A0AAD2K7L2_9AGAR|nr:unnamed protein product [Mycena citricolor]